MSRPVGDQRALHGVLVKVRDLGMCLISVHRLDPDRRRNHDPGRNPPVRRTQPPNAAPDPPAGRNAGYPHPTRATPTSSAPVGYWPRQAHGRARTTPGRR